MDEIKFDPIKVLPDGRGVWVLPMTYGKWRLVVGPVGSNGYDDAW